VGMCAYACSLPSGGAAGRPAARTAPPIRSSAGSAT
jgi:hypothetical protein